MATLISVLVVYCVTTLLTSADGPFGVFYRLRKVKWLGALDCFLCTSVYAGALVALLQAGNVPEFIIWTLAFSGGAIFLHKLERRDG